jgi:hypothetical protein
VGRRFFSFKSAVSGKSAIFVLALVFSVSLAPHRGFAAGKKRPGASPPGVSFFKKAIALSPVSQESIELPDGKAWEFGQDFEARLGSVLTQSGEFLVVDESPTGNGTSRLIQALRSASEAEPSDPWVWAGSTTPAARVRFRTRALSFVTGSRGERMMYGFDSRRPKVEAHEEEEFPLREVAFEPNWFDRHFEGRGSSPFDSLAGLDLGDGFRLDAIFAFFTLKQARYRARLELDMEVESGRDGRVEARTLGISGEGFFFDVSGGYLQYAAGLRVARTDAILQVFRKAIQAASGEIRAAVAPFPRLARIDGLLREEKLVFLGTGPGARVPIGTRFRVGEAQILEVLREVSSGSVAQVVFGEFAELSPGAIAVEESKDAEPGARVGFVARSVSALRAPLTPRSEIVLPWGEVPRADLGELIPKEGFWDAVWKSWVGAALLPYRIWRSYQRDQTYHRESDSGPSLTEFLQEQRKSAWAKGIGLSDSLAPAAEDSVVVAILDTGMDYNHSVLHSGLWLNPRAETDSMGRSDHYGWDFVSGDPRPFDDHDRGTELASLVRTIAPQAKILPVKIFNPFGVTTSSSVRAGFEYAIRAGAKVLLCGWSTRRHSQAIEEGIRLAEREGVLVVAAAGDRGEDLDRVRSYPVSLAREFPGTVIGVASLNAIGDALVKESGRFSNHGASVVGIAAPATGIRVARPRGRFGQAPASTALSAALVAGALARMDPELPAHRKLEALWMQADVLPALGGEGVAGGRRLRLPSSGEPSKE